MEVVKKKKKLKKYKNWKQVLYFLRDTRLKMILQKDKLISMLINAKNR